MDAHDWDRRYLDQPSPWTDEANRFLAETVADLEPGRALDLACGEGRNALWLARRGWSVTGLDFSSVAVDRARDIAADEELDARFETIDLRHWTPDDDFDLVCVLYLHLAHSDLGPILARAAEAVAPGGTLFVVGHHIENLEHGSGGPQSADVLYTESDLADWCPLPPARLERITRQTPAGGTAVDALLVAHRRRTPE
jgi:SAM-dependent methyltransferase